jgi:methionyl-tRNA formyltransferase
MTYTKDTLRVIFLGTPDFAVASLEALIQNKYNVVAVVTAPDKPAGRGMQLKSSAVKTCAVNHNIPVLQPEKLKTPNFIAELKSYQADVQIVVAFRMLPEVVWNMPPLGTINVHASLLPNYRGAAPINWAIINGETETGVTTFRLKHEIDTGNILLQQRVAILPEDNIGTLYNKLMSEGAQLLITTLEGILDNKIKSKPQDENAMQHHAPKIFKEHCLIDFNKPAQTIHNLIRGLSPIPGAYTFINNKTFKIYLSDIALEDHNYPYSTYLTDNKTYLKFATPDGWIYAKEVQLEGKKRMNIIDFLRGNKIEMDG